MSKDALRSPPSALHLILQALRNGATVADGEVVLRYRDGAYYADRADGGWSWSWNRRISEAEAAERVAWCILHDFAVVAPALAQAYDAQSATRSLEEQHRELLHRVELQITGEDAARAVLLALRSGLVLEYFDKETIYRWSFDGARVIEEEGDPVAVPQITRREEHQEDAFVAMWKHYFQIKRSQSEIGWEARERWLRESLRSLGVGTIRQFVCRSREKRS